jgi:uncharacterized caspase-like protein
MTWKTLCAVWFLAVMNAATASWAQGSEAGTRYCDTHNCRALLIANDDYSYGETFNTSIPGMQKISAQLAAIGFSSQEVRDASRAEILDSLNQFSAEPGVDLSLILFIGNGVTLYGDDYIMPSDARVDYSIEDNDEFRVALKNSSIPTRSLLELHPGTDLNISIVDSGRIDPFAPEVTRGLVIGREQLSEDLLEMRDLDRDIESMLLYSTAPGQTAFDEPLFADIVANAFAKEGDIVRVLAAIADEMAVKTDLFQYPELEVYGVRGRPICLISCDTPGPEPGASFFDQLQELEGGTCEGDFSADLAGSERYALVIGNNGYSQTDSWGRLKEPVNDADTISAALDETDFAVRKCHNLPISRMRSEIEAFQTFYQQRVENSADEITPAAFFYFSGHGAADEATNYMIPTDSKADEADELPEDAISIDQFTSRFPDAGAQIMVVIDACRNALKNSDDKSGHKGLQPFIPRPNMIIASATMPGELAKQDSGYARFLADRITQTDDNFYESEVGLVFRDVGDRVEDKTRGQQRPDTIGTFSGRFFFQTSP